MGQLLESLVYMLSDLQPYSFYLNRYRLVKLIHNLFILAICSISTFVRAIREDPIVCAWTLQVILGVFRSFSGVCKTHRMNAISMKEDTVS